MQRLNAQQAEEAENNGSNPSQNEIMGDIIATRFSKRDLLKGTLAVTAINALMPQAFAQSKATFNFKEVSQAPDEKIHVADGYKADVLIKWGDKVEKGAAQWSPATQTGATQAKQFGYNNDYLGFIPLNGSSKHGLLCVNHEYTNEELMFPDLDGRQDAKAMGFRQITLNHVETEMMAHGGSVLEIKSTNGVWGVVDNSKYNRRITLDTPMTITGAAAGHERMKTGTDSTGRKVIGMINNCAGGKTPWGTWVTCEENFNGYFWVEGVDVSPSLKRYGMPRNRYAWGKHFARFNYAKEPNEANRFGWVVEIDPLDPTSTPKKRTALGRFKHEGAAGLTNKDGRYVIYMGDDERYEYIYRFVSRNKVTGNRKTDFDLLEEGTLSVAHYKADGTMEWRNLTWGEGGLTPANGFHSQADVLIDARKAGDILGATKMDRPEDVEANPKTNKVYAMLTNNVRRNLEQRDAANPRNNNRFGHIVEMTPPDGDHSATQYTWEILVKCGDPSIATVGATFNPATSKDGWFGMPDNCAVDSDGRLWITTDGNYPSRTGRTDGLFAMETQGTLRGTSKRFFQVPLGAEMCGPEFTPDMETMFLAVQHPGEADDEDPNASPTHYNSPATRWPDFNPKIPPRPSVVVITKKGGGKIAF